MKKLDSFLLVDAHVHIQDCFSLPQFFRGAYDNFRKEASKFGGDFSALLLLSEISGTDYFRKLLNLCDNGADFQDEVYGTWRFARTGESCSVAIQSDKGESLIVVAGRQVITEEKLEVLALLTDEYFSDGDSLVETVDKVRDEGAVVVIPWGVGKWLGSRGKLLTDYVAKAPREVFLGDNGGRPTIWGCPDHFKQARARGMAVLPGSDPLPLTSEVERAGSFGFILPHKLTSNQPAGELKKRLFANNASIQAYGSLRSPVAFLKDQINIRLK